ncbi:membrane-spanning 4-domains subfamily A member 12-like [Dasypus novemcinctus]|uniref:membrane-spanning 4-domains subfamily A member 12-like n=1 Tax=Dasypus novemcinctus TaxID=9361 RepID=UPI00265D90AD|nr:membrane-spanning 4-domains subfamily A member 8-like [Dasypus novemcinctus]
MPSFHIVLKKETRMLGAAQVMIGLIHCALGHIWIQLYISQSNPLLMVYLPIVLLTGYPFWAALFFILSGYLAITTEKRPSKNLLMYTIRTNIQSIALATIGLLFIVMEFVFFLLKQGHVLWLHKSGIILSVYLGIFSTLELLLAKKVVKWGIEANHRSIFAYNVHGSRRYFSHKTKNGTIMTPVQDGKVNNK